MPRTWIRTGLVASAVAAVVLVPQAAYANSPLAGSTVVSTTAPANYTFSTVSHYWSVVAVTSSADYDLSLWLPNGRLPLATSAYGSGVTDFIAINSNLRPLGSYVADVTRHGTFAFGAYYVEQVQGSTVTTLPIPDNNGVTGPSDPDLAFSTVNSQDVIDVSDVYLDAGDKFWVNDSAPGQNFFFLESNPADSTTFVRTRAQATAVSGTSESQGCTLYTANYTGWHGFAELTQGLPHMTSPQEGLATAVDRFDPARPTTCPQRNFPAPTPAGP